MITPRISGALFSAAAIILFAPLAARAADGDNVVLEWNDIALHATATADRQSSENHNMAMVRWRCTTRSRTFRLLAHRPYSVILLNSSVVRQGCSGGGGGACNAVNLCKPTRNLDSDSACRWIGSLRGK